jgi:hypothetical protein
MLCSFGVGRTEQELTRLEEKARGFIEEQSGFVGRLFQEESDALLDDFVASLSNAQIRVIRPELIFGALYDKISYNAIPSELFRYLVICRLFCPGSKLNTIDYLYRYQGITYSSDTIYQFFNTLCLKKEKEKSKSGDKNACRANIV